MSLTPYFNAVGVPSRRILVSARLKSAESLNDRQFSVTCGGEPRPKNLPASLPVTLQRHSCRAVSS
jgi:hypothetical protein